MQPQYVLNLLIDTPPVNTMHLQLLLRLSRPRHPLHRQPMHLYSLGNHDSGHGLIDASLRIVILHRQYIILAFMAVLDDVFSVQGLHREKVEDADVDGFGLEHFGGEEGLVEGDATADDEQLVVRGGFDDFA